MLQDFCIHAIFSICSASASNFRAGGRYSRSAEVAREAGREVSNLQEETSQEMHRLANERRTEDAAVSLAKDTAVSSVSDTSGEDTLQYVEPSSGY